MNVNATETVQVGNIVVAGTPAKEWLLNQVTAETREYMNLYTADSAKWVLDEQRETIEAAKAAAVGCGATYQDLNHAIGVGMYGN